MCAAKIAIGAPAPSSCDFGQGLNGHLTCPPGSPAAQGERLVIGLAPVAVKAKSLEIIRVTTSAL